MNNIPAFRSSTVAMSTDVLHATYTTELPIVGPDSG
jgi:hypothetical protein